MPVSKDPVSHSSAPGEIIAALHAVAQTPLDAPLRILSTNDILTSMIITKSPEWEDHGWIDVSQARHTRVLLNRLRQRCAVTSLGKIVRPEDRKTLDKARQSASSNRSLDLFPLIPPPTLTEHPRFDITGAKLPALTQALAYKGIIAWRNTPPRRVTSTNLDTIRNRTPEDTMANKTIWLSTRHKDFSRSFATFLWKCIHGVLRCGSYWLAIPGLEHRAQCSFCGMTESITHILFECTATGQREIWQIITGLWLKKGLPWPDMTTVDVHTLGLKTWTDERNRVRPGATRLWRIMISEATHLIWKLRCDRVIGHQNEESWEHSPLHVRCKLAYVLNSRLAIDVEATRKRYGKQALSHDLVLATWNAVIYDELALPDDWTKCKGFLVGSSPILRVDIDPG
ncbi:uncharacterized protein B0H18DRAFT_883347 [Fomitopsis serialis]|uniref:uncharacterized protein n=1 Tax=Fomitopsis serialis TaxID=139415 RepID=UPI0020073FF9|nr:uncharacterized protein B0H18DRAFT_883347 [Neoantrodia serialis]KAH9917801.1 hypothetical protein B0H18DRAFT_883347 [Neoantrodia serialis]